jgi:hypothetical protein
LRSCQRAEDYVLGQAFTRSGRRVALPLILSWPVGVHERYNRRWAIENGPGLKQRDPAHASYWMREWLNDGTLAGAAWTGFVRMPKFGLYQILERVCCKG